LLVTGIFFLQCEPISILFIHSHVLEISTVRRLVIGCDLKALSEQVDLHCCLCIKSDLQLVR
jgi:hypothetical protein